MLFYIGSTMERSVRAMDRLTFLDNGSPAFNLRACLVSFENNADKSQRKHLERIMQKPFTIFPKSATLIDPTK